ncbi:hypothetical protein ETB97_001415 [Aspergillus alliaceus]|uniref:FMN hydroxy acid dehydrogenase domain-containing protein n=1 Tax=Petromyces alliaceus TaxID=209559 RepID=A0A8H6A4N2_PETAA|nr:hypothetical protein ETB97_001415 [Aspergillus burnettii]
MDCPTLGKRIDEHRNDFVIPGNLCWPNLLSRGKEAFFGQVSGMDFDASIEWHIIIPWLRQTTPLQIWVKGVSTAEDVELAVQYGVEGVVISNHGGRQLDGVPSPLDALRECALVAKGRIRIAVDGGIRRGSDIFKALAMGAQHCFLGRIPIWGLDWSSGGRDMDKEESNVAVVSLFKIDKHYCDEEEQRKTSKLTGEIRNVPDFPADILEELKVALESVILEKYMLYHVKNPLRGEER